MENGSKKSDILWDNELGKVQAVYGSPSNNLNESAGSESGKWTFFLTLAAVTCCLGCAVPAGFNIGSINTPMNHIKSFCNESVKNEFDKDVSEKTLNMFFACVVSIFVLGGMIGSLTASHFAHKFGRRGAMAIGHLFGILGAIFLLTCSGISSMELLLIGRFLVGISGGLATSLLPMYMVEIAPINLRGPLGSLCQLGITLGVLLGQAMSLNNVMGTEKLWPYMLASFAPLCIFALIITYFLPESPKYLYITKRNPELARKALSKLRAQNFSLIQNEIANLDKEMHAAWRTEKYSIWKVLRDPTLRLPLMIVCVMQAGQQLSGVNAVFYYSAIIFKSAGLDENTSQYATLGTGIANFGMALVSGTMLKYWGRKPAFLTSCVASIICLLTLGIALKTAASYPAMQTVSIIMVLAYIVFYGLGLGPIPFFIGSELFDVGPRPTAMALGSFFNWTGNFIVGISFGNVIQEVGPYVFLFFCLFLLITAGFTWAFLPETKGKNPSDVRESLSHGLKFRINLT